MFVFSAMTDVEVNDSMSTAIDDADSGAVAGATNNSTMMVNSTVLLPYNNPNPNPCQSRTMVSRSALVNEHNT